MTENTIYVRATRAAVRQAVAKIPSAAFGEHGAKVVADQMMERTGLIAKGRIYRAFIVKARGGTDEAGEKWKPLSPKTIAYSRRHAGVPKAEDRASSRPSWMLTDDQRERWWGLYRQGLVIFKGNKGSAARRAWAVSKRDGAQTLIGRYGTTQVDILRSTDVLFNTLSPGVESANAVFRIGRGEVIVGTNVPYAIIHHEGRGHIPQRRLWPEPRKWPSSWWLDLLETARSGLVDIAMLLIRGAK